MTPPIYDLTNRRLEQVEAQWNARGKLDEGQISFLIGLAKAYVDRPEVRTSQSESFRLRFPLPEGSIFTADTIANAGPDMLAVLKAVEFVGERDLEDGYVLAACPFCQGAMSAGHEDECALAAVIARAEGR